MGISERTQRYCDTQERFLKERLASGHSYAPLVRYLLRRIERIRAGGTGRGRVYGPASALQRRWLFRK